jgi:hypothetical protein
VVLLVSEQLISQRAELAVAVAFHLERAQPQRPEPPAVEARLLPSSVGVRSGLD